MKILQRIIIIFVITGGIFAQNKALFLDGNNDYVDLPQPVIDHDSYSMEAWFCILGDAGGVEQQSTIFNQGTDATGCYHSKILFHAMARADLPNSSFGIRTEQGCFERATAPYAGKNEWHHLVGVSDAVNIKLYSDGELIAVEPITQVGSFSSNIDYVEIGRHQHDNQTFGSFFGLLDEIRVWDYPLSQAEIIARMHTELDGNEQGLIAYWNFNDDSANDLTGNENNGTFMGGASTVAMELPNSPNGTWGDLNDDGQINISDVILLINHIIGQ